MAASLLPETRIIAPARNAGLPNYPGLWADKAQLPGNAGGNVVVAAFDAQAFHQCAMWVALGYGDVPHEPVLTNQRIVSVERYACGNR